MISNPEQELALPLLRNKITIPLLPQEFVHRPRLTDQINRGLIRPLTSIFAPAGFGKTNLLIEWAAQNSFPVAWLTLNREDNDLVRFCRYLIAALQEVSPRLGEEALDYIQSTKSSGREMGITLLINEISSLPYEVALVVDEFHVLEDPVILQTVSFFIRHLPRNLHLLLAGRHEPALELAFLRAKGLVTELGTNDLRFNAEEVAQFFNQVVGMELPPETVTALEQRTEGWVAALQLAALSLRNQSNPVTLLNGFHGDAHYLVDFLSEEVLNRQPEDVRQFLLRSSILDILNGPLCEAVVNPAAPPGYGARMLDLLDHANLFVTPLDPQHEWFRFHQLFADFLRHIQNETKPAEVPLMHKRAATWFEQQRNFAEAFKHALASEDGDWAADLIERNIEALIKAGELPTLTYWIEKLPNGSISQRPLLDIAYAWGLITAYHLDRAIFYLDHVEQTLEQFTSAGITSEPVEDPGYRNILGGLAICRSMLALISGDIEKAAEFSRTAVAYLPKDNPFIQSMVSLEDSLYFTLLGDTTKAIEILKETTFIARGANNLLALVIASCELAEMQAMQGHLNQALVTLQKAQYIVLDPNGKRLPLAGIVDNGIGEILRERDQLDEAKEYLEQGRNLTQMWWSLSSLDGLVSLAQVLQSQGDISGSEALIAEAAQLALSTESSQWDDDFTSAIAARLALKRNDLPAAIQWLSKRGLLESSAILALENYPYHVYEYLLLTQARYYLVQGQNSGDPAWLTRAYDLLKSILPEVERFERVASKIEILVLQALIEFAQGDIDPAVKTLLSALALGEPEGYRRIFLDEGQPMAKLLDHCQKALSASGSYLPSDNYIASLLAALRPVNDTLRRFSITEGKAGGMSATLEDGFTIELSPREIEVLTLIAAGKSNQEISNQLFLALNTVKRHAYNIYAKLDVKKRTQAVKKARQLGLIP